MKQASNATFTENGAWTYQSSGDCCLDFFATAGALRNADQKVIITRFIRAFAESREYAMKTLFFARDIRGGLGERRVFQTALRYLANAQPSLTVKNIPIIAEYGRFDDLLVLIGTKSQQAAIDYIRGILSEDNAKMTRGEPISLLAKWLPSINTSSRKQTYLAKMIAKELKMSHAEYRKCLSALRGHIDVLERRLCKVDYSFDYEKQPSRALFKYRAAFIRHDEKRYTSFLARVREGNAVLKTGGLYSYDIIRACEEWPSEWEREILDMTWNALEDHTDGRNALVVVDGSGSMYHSHGRDVRPIDVAISLGIYFAERNKGAFRNHFITFSETPHLVKIQGGDIAEKVSFYMSFNEIANTNLLKTFELILRTALLYHTPQEELPETLYIISDMEFDCCVKQGGKSKSRWTVLPTKRLKTWEKSWQVKIACSKKRSVRIAHGLTQPIKHCCFDERVWQTAVESMIVRSENNITVVFRSGAEIQAEVSL